MGLEIAVRTLLDEIHPSLVEAVRVCLTYVDTWMQWSHRWSSKSKQTRLHVIIGEDSVVLNDPDAALNSLIHRWIQALSVKDIHKTAAEAFVRVFGSIR